MKKLLIASTVAALSVTAAHAAPTVYGKAFLTLDLQDGDKELAGLYDTRTQLNSNGSRIGLKGGERLTANTDLVYQLEYGIKVDDNSPQFTSRDTYLGLANKQYGTLLAGRLTAIDGMVDYANVTAGGVIGGDNVLASFDAPRANNAFAYVSPSYNGLNFLGMYVLDENKTTDTLQRDAFGVGVQYAPKANYRGGASYIQSGDTKAVRVSGSLDLTPATTIGALYQSTEYSTLHQAILRKGAETENAVTLSATHKYGQTPWTALSLIHI